MPDTLVKPARFLAETAGYLLNRRSRDRADRETLEEFRWSPGALPAGMTLRWLGTAGFELAYLGHTVLIDPYLSRIPLRQVIGRRAVRAREDVLDQWVRSADAILVGHTHFDHALDVPAIARRTGAKVYGSESLRTLLGLYRLADQAVVATPYRSFQSGPFTITFVPSLHSKLSLGLRVPSAGEITCEHLDDLMPRAYRCSQTWGIHIAVDGFSLYHQGSAEIDDEAVRHRGVDVFLCGIAGRQVSDRFVDRALRLLEPRLVVPTHYDDFLRPLDAPPGFTVDVDVTGFVKEVHAVSPDFDIRTVEPGERLS
ncbi:MAG: MBL fold metallo-hydrolase [Streptosporangiaceae bacterium]